MTDHVSPQRRSFIMAKVKSENTGPELAVRRMIHALGYRYRLHKRNLPGSPDLVFKRRQKVIFVHGCFWHGHGCRHGRLPKSKLDYWGPKIEANKKRDNDKMRQLREAGWDILVVWQCELKRSENLLDRLRNYLGPPSLRQTR